MSASASAPAPTPAAAAPAAAAVPIAARPGWTTSEFWTTNLVHVMGVIATALVILGDDERGLEAMEAAVPILALAISAVLSFAYSKSRARAKLNTVASFAEGVAADLAHIAPLLERDARLAEPVVAALDPAVLDRLHAASQAYRKAAS